jgi:hypothetical protein
MASWLVVTTGWSVWPTKTHGPFCPKPIAAANIHGPRVIRLGLLRNLKRVSPLIDGHIPDTYHGDRAIMEPDAVTSDPRLVREYSLRNCVCSVIVEGLSVPWNLEFPPVHAVTWSLGWALYEHSKKFENALCGEIYSRSTPAPYEIFQGDELVDESLVHELATEIARIASPGSDLWADERYRNLYLILQRGAEENFRILASYM